MEDLFGNIHLIQPIKFNTAKLIIPKRISLCSHLFKATELLSPVKQEKAQITKLLQSYFYMQKLKSDNANANVSNLKKMVWKLQEENNTLRELLCLCVNSIEEDNTQLTKYFFISMKK